jgi:low affinity Fe/Cu permease
MSMHTDGGVTEPEDHSRGTRPTVVERGVEASRIGDELAEEAEAAARAGNEGYPLGREGEEPSQLERDISGPRAGVRQRRIVHRTAQLPVTSRVLYRIEHYTSLPGVALVITAAMICLVGAGVLLGFPSSWVAAFEVSVSAVTLVMVFAIQHTQGREQAATQRKLDELIRALPGADESLMMLEEAPGKVMLDVEEEQRDIRSASSVTE